LQAGVWAHLATTLALRGVGNRDGLKAGGLESVKINDGAPKALQELGKEFKELEQTFLGLRTAFTFPRNSPAAPRLVLTKSRPRSSGLRVSTFFFLAFMMLGSEA